MFRFLPGLLMLLCAFVRADTDPAASLEGYWSGHAEHAGRRSDIAVRLFAKDGALAGTVDWPSMGYLRADLLGVRNQAASVRLGVPLPIGAIYLGGTHGADRMSGTLERVGLVNGEWTSLGTAGSFELTRGEEPALPYTIEPVAFTSGAIELSGALFLPAGTERTPGIVYLAGSGDTTRGDGSFLADSLARAGIAALVYDKRGAGRSGGNWRNGGFDELAADAIAALRLLQARAEIDAKRTGFVCQSQGCWVAPIALRRGAAAHFLVAQSGPGVSVADEDLDFYRVRLAGQGFGETHIQAAFALVRIDQRLSRGEASWDELQQAIAQNRNAAWFGALHYEPQAQDDPERGFSGRTLGYDPGADLDAIRIPSLWVYGEADTIIPVNASIARVRGAGAQPKPVLVTLPGAGHSFTIDADGLPRLAEGYPALVGDWIRAQH